MRLWARSSEDLYDWLMIGIYAIVRMKIIVAKM